MLKKLMQGFYDLKTIYKLLFLVAFMSVCMLAVGVVGLYFNTKANDSLSIIYKYNLQPIRWINMFRVHTNANKSNVLSMIIDNNKEHKEQFKADLEDRISQSNVLLADFKKAMTELNNEEALKSLTELESEIEAYRTIREEVINLAMADKAEEAFKKLNTNSAKGKSYFF